MLVLLLMRHAMQCTMLQPNCSSGAVQQAAAEQAAVAHNNAATAQCAACAAAHEVNNHPTKVMTQVVTLGDHAALQTLQLAKPQASEVAKLQ